MDSSIQFRNVTDLFIGVLGSTFSLRSVSDPSSFSNTFRFLVSDKKNRGNGIHPDSVAEFDGHFNRQPFREIIYCCLGSGITRNAGDSSECRHGGDMNDTSLLLSCHHLTKNIGGIDTSV